MFRRVTGCLVADVSTNSGGITFKGWNVQCRTPDFSIRINETITLSPIDAAPQPSGMEIIKKYSMRSKNKILKKFIFAHSLTGRNTDLPNKVKVAEGKQFLPLMPCVRCLLHNAAPQSGRCEHRWWWHMPPSQPIFLLRVIQLYVSGIVLQILKLRILLDIKLLFRKYRFERKYFLGTQIWMSFGV